MSNTLKQITLYTDGACIGNPGPGGYAVVLLYGAHRRELSGGVRLTTNNRMEILAAIVGLETLKERCAVTVYSDSQYLVDSMTLGWAVRWRADGWRRDRKKRRVVNADLWARLLDLCAQHDVAFVWVKGHAGNQENERCDWLALRAAARSDGVDVGYEQPIVPESAAPSLFK